MKIGIISLILNKGGSTRQAIELAKKLKQHEVIIYTSKVKDPYDLTGLNIKVIKTYPNKILSLLFTFLFRLKQVLLFRYKKTNRSTSLFRIFQAREFASKIDLDLDVINPHGKVAHWVSYFYKKRKNIPSVWQMNTPKKEFMSLLPIDAQDQIVCLDEKSQKQAFEFYK